MSVLQGKRNPSADQAAAKPSAPADRSPASSTGVRHTRISAAWVGVCASAAVLVVLIVFMLPNTRSVEITFLGMHGTLPLALALLIAGAGTPKWTMMAEPSAQGQESIVDRRPPSSPRSVTMIVLMSEQSPRHTTPTSRGTTKWPAVCDSGYENVYHSRRPNGGGPARRSLGLPLDDFVIVPRSVR